MTSDFGEWILYEDADLIVVNKPPFIATLEDRESPQNMLGLARAYWPDAQACHRLDKDTSGALVFAKHPEAYRYMSIQFEKRLVQKTYHAVSDGLFEFDHVRVEKPILKKSGGLVKIDRSGSKALTVITTLETFAQHSLIECRPVTGRMHQVRIHLAAMNAPISGDEAYGGKPVFLSHLKRGYALKKGTEELPLMQRMALHAHHIEFISPEGKQIEVPAPYQKDMRALLRQLRANP